MTFAWFTDLAWIGFRRDLRHEDLWDLEPDIRCKVLHEEFDRQLRRKGRSNANKTLMVDANGANKEMELNDVANCKESAMSPKDQVFS